MNILIVEDHPDTRSVLQRMLSRWGHDVAEASDVQSGLGQLMEKPFDVIVSDIALPDGTGYALMNQARHSGSKAVAIAISAYPFPPEIEEPKVTGFDYHLNKPFTASELRRVVERQENGSEETEAALVR